MAKEKKKPDHPHGGPPGQQPDPTPPPAGVRHEVTVAVAATGRAASMTNNWVLPPGGIPFTAATSVNNAATYPVAPVRQPAAGEWYTDPVFCTRIMRLTDATTADSSHVPYAYWPPWNKDSTKLFVQYWPVGGINSNSIARLWDFDPVTGAASNARDLQTGATVLNQEGLIWSRSDANLLYGISSAGDLKLYSLVPTNAPAVVVDLTSRLTAALATAHRLFQLSMGGTDRYFAFTVMDVSAQPVGFAVYDRQTDTLYPRAVGTIAGSFDECHLSRDGAVLMISQGGGPTSQVWDFAAHPTAAYGDHDMLIVAAHEDFGPQTTMIGADVPETSGVFAVWDLAAFNAGTKTAAQATTQIINIKAPDATVDWPSPHWSWQNLTDSHDAGLAYVSADITTDQTAAWRAYFEEIIKVWTDASGPGPAGSKWRRLCHHRSDTYGNTGGAYRSFPKGAVDPSGRWFAYTSNWNKAAVFVGNVDRIDVYILKIPTEAEFAAGHYL